jgi:hypothetical protein
MVASCNLVDGILEVRIQESMGQATTTCSIVATNMKKGGDGKQLAALNDIVQVTLGTDSLSGLAFTGLVKTIQKDYPPGKVTLTCEDMSVRLKEFFVIPYPTRIEYTNQTNGYTAESIVSQFLEHAMLGNGALGVASKPYTNFSWHTSGFSFATLGNTTSPGFVAENKSAYDVIKEIADLLSFSIWADYKGGIHFKRRPHYPEHSLQRFPPNNGNIQDPAGPSLSFLEFSKAKQNIISVKYSSSTENVRNQIMVAGANQLKYNIYQSPPLMPGSSRYALPHSGQPFTSLVDNSAQSYDRDFYQGTEFGTAFLISDENQTQLNSAAPDINHHNNLVKTATYNLLTVNRLHETAVVQVPGDYRIHALLSNDGGGGNGNPVQSIAVVRGDWDTANFIPELDSASYGDWLVYGMASVWSRAAYNMELTLTRAT